MIVGLGRVRTRRLSGQDAQGFWSRHCAEERSGARGVSLLFLDLT